jgi:hypothetical protein
MFRKTTGGSKITFKPENITKEITADETLVSMCKVPKIFESNFCKWYERYRGLRNVFHVNNISPLY